MTQLDYLVVGAGFYGATFARLAQDAGKSVAVIESRSHIAGNAFTQSQNGIDVHVYGPHIFHTNDKKIWDFVNKFGEFNNFVNSPKAYRDGKLYSLPFNMHTFYELWGCTTPDQAKAIIEKQRVPNSNPQNLEQQALNLVGRDLYDLLIKDYTRKQWQTDPSNLPADIIKRIPLRFTFDNNYFNDRYQGIPVDGYTAVVANMLKGIDVSTDTDFFADKQGWKKRAKNIVFTGRIDQYFDYCYGDLEYRTLKFEHSTVQTVNHQGCAVINYTSADMPWTRIIEHVHFNPKKTSQTIITKEIPTAWDRNQTPYYPINNTKNQQIFERYQELASQECNTIFGGRLAEYRYYDMHQVIGSAMKTAKTQGLL